MAKKDKLTKSENLCQAIYKNDIERQMTGEE